MTDVEWAWVAGLLEGEGCFTICWKKYKRVSGEARKLRRQLGFDSRRTK